MSQEDTAVNTEVVEQEPTATESAPVETKEPEVVEDNLLKVLSEDESKPETETEEQPAEEAPKEELPSDEPVEETETEGQPQGEKELAPKSENRFQKLANENRALREYVEQLNAKVYQPQTTEELIDEGLSPELAEVRALKQQLEVQNYNNRVVEAQTGLAEEAKQVLSDFPLFDPDSPDFDADIARDAADALRASLIVDPNTGQIIGSHLSPYQIYKPIYDAHKKASMKGQIQGQKATEKMLANVESRSSTPPRESKKDPLLEILSSDD